MRLSALHEAKVGEKYLKGANELKGEKSLRQIAIKAGMFTKDGKPNKARVCKIFSKGRNMTGASVNTAEKIAQGTGKSLPKVVDVIA